MDNIFDLFRRIASDASPAQSVSPIEWLLVGLGNPGAEYAKTRHNAGFMAIDYMSEKAGFTVTKSEYVDAPIIDQYPLTLECRVKELQDDTNGYILIGEVVNMTADESILTDGEVDLGKLRAICFDSSANKYRVIGEAVGDAFSCGTALIKK